MPNVMSDRFSRIPETFRRSGRDLLSTLDRLKRPSEQSAPPWRAKVLSREALGELGARLAKDHAGHVAPSYSRRLLARYGHNRRITSGGRGKNITALTTGISLPTFE